MKEVNKKSEIIEEISKQVDKYAKVSRQLPHGEPNCIPFCD